MAALETGRKAATWSRWKSRVVSDFWRGADGIRLPDGATLTPVVIGDAETANMSVTPVALRDAVVAATHLVPLVAGSPDPAQIDAACRVIQSEREPEIVRAQTLQRREAQGQGDARAGSWRYALAKHGARLLGRYRWAQRAWLARQHDLRFGSTTVRLTAAGAHRTPAS